MKLLTIGCKVQTFLEALEPPGPSFISTSFEAFCACLLFLEPGLGGSEGVSGTGAGGVSGATGLSFSFPFPLERFFEALPLSTCSAAAAGSAAGAGASGESSGAAGSVAGGSSSWAASGSPATSGASTSAGGAGSACDWRT